MGRMEKKAGSRLELLVAAVKVGDPHLAAHHAMELDRLVLRADRRFRWVRPLPFVVLVPAYGWLAAQSWWVTNVGLMAVLVFMGWSSGAISQRARDRVAAIQERQKSLEHILATPAENLDVAGYDPQGVDEE